MTEHNEAITKQLLSQLPHYTPGLDWQAVFRAALERGESQDYARFLADEHCRLNKVPDEPTPGPSTPPEGKKLTVVSLFAGGGGLDLGLEAAGFETIFASDIDEHSCRTLEAGKRFAIENGLPFLRSATIKQADIRTLSADEILGGARLGRGEVDLLAGGPPCQAFSVFGKRLGVNDSRGRGLLLYEYLRLLREIRPKAFIFENVFGLLTIHAGETFKELKELLSKPDEETTYTLSVFRLNAASFGVPQHRDRVFIIGSRDGIEIPEIPELCKAPGLFTDKDALPFRTVKHAFRGLPPLGKRLANHTGRKHSERIISRYRSLAFGERDPKTRINKLDPSRPSYTIIVGSDHGGGKGHVHPHEPREVSPRESARIQTFPDWWAFSGTSRHPIRQVGNAVPPLMAALIGREMIATLFGGGRKSLRELAEALGQKHLFDESIDEL